MTNEEKVAALQAFASPHYKPNEYPVLLNRFEMWRQSRPLQGLRILDAAPFFRNTFLKYVNLLAAGCELTIGLHDGFDCDLQMLELVNKINIPIINQSNKEEKFDIILDCGAAYHHLQSTYGFVELTRSGSATYTNIKRPVFIVDDTKIKLIETMLGTGNGLLRGLKQFWRSDLKGVQALLFGFGKVGKGIAQALEKEGAVVTVVDHRENVDIVPHKYSFIAAQDRTSLEKAIQEQDVIITATGCKAVVEKLIDIQKLNNSHAVLANMGYEDEFGSQVPAERALNNKMPLNFGLEDPTLMKYIDATLALHNECALLLTSGKITNGVNNVPSKVEAEFLEIMRRNWMTEQEEMLLNS